MFVLISFQSFGGGTGWSVESWRQSRALSITPRIAIPQATPQQQYWLIAHRLKGLTQHTDAPLDYLRANSFNKGCLQRVLNF